jgi:dihydrofolate reductase
MDLCLIWAQDRAGAVGRNNAIPWHVPEDMRYFRDLTMGCPVIMGRRTWETIGARPLPGRQNIVLMRENDSFDVDMKGAVRSCSIGDAIMLAGSGRPAKAFIIGGPDLHLRALPVAQRVYVTEVDLEVDGADAFAPQVPPTQWRRHVESDLFASRAGMRYRFVEYRRAGRH